MSRVLHVYIDDDTEKRMELLVRESGDFLTSKMLCTLAEAAVAEAACSAFRHRPDDPAARRIGDVARSNSGQTPV